VVTLSQVEGTAIRPITRPVNDVKGTVTATATVISILGADGWPFA
jgi:hypothetical protein